MALGDAYATAEEYRAALDGKDPQKDNVILVDLLACSRFMERITQVLSFNVDEADTTRLYYADPGGSDQIQRIQSAGASLAISGVRELWIDPLSADPTSIKIDEDQDGLFTDETALASTAYELRPLNAQLNPEPEPFTSIVLTRWGNKGAWPIGSRVQVVGKFGWPSVPPAIKQACIQLTAIWRIESPRATIEVSQGFESVTSLSTQAAGIVERMVRSYRSPQY